MFLHSNGGPIKKDPLGTSLVADFNICRSFEFASWFQLVPAETPWSERRNNYRFWDYEVDDHSYSDEEDEPDTYEVYVEGKGFRVHPNGSDAGEFDTTKEKVWKTNLRGPAWADEEDPDSSLFSSINYFDSEFTGESDSVLAGNLIMGNSVPHQTTATTQARQVSLEDNSRSQSPLPPSSRNLVDTNLVTKRKSSQQALDSGKSEEATAPKAVPKPRKPLLSQPKLIETISNSIPTMKGSSMVGQSERPGTSLEAPSIKPKSTKPRTGANSHPKKLDAELALVSEVAKANKALAEFRASKLIAATLVISEKISPGQESPIPSTPLSGNASSTASKDTVKSLPKKEPSSLKKEPSSGQPPKL